MTGAENYCVKLLDIARDTGQSTDRTDTGIEGKRYNYKIRQLSNDDDAISIRVYHDLTQMTTIIINCVTNEQRKTLHDKATEFW